MTARQSTSLAGLAQPAGKELPGQAGRVRAFASHPVVNQQEKRKAALEDDVGGWAGLQRDKRPLPALAIFQPQAWYRHKEGGNHALVDSAEQWPGMGLSGESPVLDFQSDLAVSDMNTELIVYVVDDDAAVRTALTMLLESAGHVVKAFAGAQEFLKACTSDMQGCAILDMRMPGMDGLALQEEMNRRGIRLPVIFLSGYGTIPTTVRTIKSGALDFLTKPVEGKVLLDRVARGLQLSSQMREENEADREITSRLMKLTEREREIMQLVVAGYTSKEIGQRLEISFRTVEIHRAHIMHKTGTSNLVELAYIAGTLEPR